MPKSLDIVCLLLALFHLCLQNVESGGDKKGVPSNATSCSKPVSSPRISSPSSETTIGTNVTVMCSSETGCPPTSYVLFLNKSKVRQAVTNKEEETVMFNFTINSTSELGEYKCRALNGFNMSKAKYSSGFYFTLRDVPDNVTSCSEPVSNPHISSPSSKTTIGANVTVTCSSETGCPPTSYVLFLNKSKVRQAVKNKKEEIVMFNFTINSTSELGDYKCRALNGFNVSKAKYSSGFYFTLREENNSLVVLTALLLLLILVLIAIALAILLLILPRCKARKLRTASASASFITTGHPSSENCPAYDDIAYGNDEEIEYCTVNINTKTENCRNGNICFVFYKWNKTGLKCVYSILLRTNLPKQKIMYIW